MNIALFYMSKVGLGGFVKYTSELYKAFQMMGHDVHLYKIRSRWEKKLRDFNEGVQSRNISIEDAKDIIINSDAAIVTATWWKGWHEDIQILLDRGAEVVIHDHTEYNKDFIEFMKSYDIRPIVIRRANASNMKKVGLDPVFIPHPYIPLMSHEDRISKKHRPVHAISVCRLDFDKRTHMLIEANEQLHRDNRIQIWGTHVRMYMYNKIVHKYKGWDDDKHYTGPNYPREHQHFSKENGYAVKLNATAEFSVDMSAIVGDGGGTQYSFLQAMDAGTIVVVNDDWLIDKHDEMLHNINCIGVGNVSDLVRLIDSSDRNEYIGLAINAEHVLSAHVPRKIVPMFMKFFEGKL